MLTGGHEEWCDDGAVTGMWLCSTDVSTDDEAGGDAQLSTKDKAELMQAMQQGQLAGMEDALPRKGLFAMPFMRRAIAKQQQDVALEAQDILAAQQLVESLPAGENGDSHQGHSGRIVLAGPAAEGRRAARKGLRVPEEEGGEEEDATAHTVRVRAAAAVQERSTAAGGGPATRRAVVKASAAGKAIKPGGPRQAAHVSVVGQSGEHASAEVRRRPACVPPHAWLPCLLSHCRAWNAPGPQQLCWSQRQACMGSCTGRWCA